MARIASPKTQERHQAIIRMREQFPNLSNHEIGVRVGVSASTVTSVCARMMGNQERSKRRPRLPDNLQTTKSNLCVAIGVIFGEHIRHARTKPDLVTTNAYLINKMTSGLHDFTTLELERIASWMNLPVSELIRAAELRLITFGNIGSF